MILHLSNLMSRPALDDYEADNEEVEFEVDLLDAGTWTAYGAEQVDLAKAIDEAADENEGYVRAEDMVRFFPGRPGMHRLTSRSEAFDAAGLVHRDAD